jgi:ATP-dependent RNA helicase DHX33
MLGAIDKNKRLTKLGRDMASLPIEPKHSRVVIASHEFGCSSEVLDIVSVISASSSLFIDVVDHREDALEARIKFRHSSGDHLTILSVMRAYQDVSSSEDKSGRKAWCRKHFINERTLLEAMEIRNQLRETCRRVGIDWRTTCSSDEQPILKSLVRGLIHNTAFLQPDGGYKQLMGPSVCSLLMISKTFSVVISR